MSTVSKDGLKVPINAQTAACEWCGATVLRGKLQWVCEDWTATDGRRGHTTATLCPTCDQLALSHRWRCGRLTGRADDLCAGCAEVAA